MPIRSLITIIGGLLTALVCFASAAGATTIDQVVGRFAAPDAAASLVTGPGLGFGDGTASAYEVRNVGEGAGSLRITILGTENAADAELTLAVAVTALDGCPTAPTADAQLIAGTATELAAAPLGTNAIAAPGTTACIWTTTAAGVHTVTDAPVVRFTLEQA